MSFRESLGGLLHQTGNDAVNDSAAIIQSPEGVVQMREIFQTYPVLEGMYDAYAAQCELDKLTGADPVALQNALAGFSLALVAMGLIAESQEEF